MNETSPAEAASERSQSSTTQSPKPVRLGGRKRHRYQPRFGLSDSLIFAGVLLTPLLNDLTETRFAAVAMGAGILIARQIQRSEKKRKRADAGLPKPPVWLNRATDGLFMSSILIILASSVGITISDWDRILTLTTLWLTTLLTGWVSLKSLVPFGQVAVGLILPLIGGIGLLGATGRLAAGQTPLALVLVLIAMFTLSIGFSLFYWREPIHGFAVTCLGLAIIASFPVLADVRWSIQDLAMLSLGTACVAVGATLAAPAVTPAIISGALATLGLAIQTIGSLHDTWWISALSCALAAFALSFLTAAAVKTSGRALRLGLMLGALSVGLDSYSLFTTRQPVFGIISAVSAFAMILASASNARYLLRRVAKAVARFPAPAAVQSLGRIFRRVGKLVSAPTNLEPHAVQQLAVVLASAFTAITWLIYK